MTEAPPPLKWHPAYAGKTWLLDWLNDDPRYRSDQMQLPILRATHFTADDPSEPAVASSKPLTLRKHRCVGPAPYVGRPFVYTWNVAIDDYGRMISGESKRMYLRWLD